MKHDVSNEESWQATVTAANEKFGPVNVLVNNAGILRFNALEFTPLEEYMQLVNINQVGCFLGMKSVTRTMRKNGGGSIINASSVEGLGGMPTLVGYSATKFARSEEHTSELQSLMRISYAVFCLKKKNNQT